MRRPFSSNPYGFIAQGAMADLRSFPAEIQDELFFVTVYAQLPLHHTADARAELHLVDARDDRQVITTLPPLEQGKPVLSRYPMRGPYALELRGVDYAVGYLEQVDSPQIARSLRPFSVDGATYTTVPVSHPDPANPRVPITRIPDGIWYLSLYTTADEDLFLQYRPVGYYDETEGLDRFELSFYKTIGASGFKRVLDRIPLRGPGEVSGFFRNDGMVYGFLST